MQKDNLFEAWLSQLVSRGLISKEASGRLPIHLSSENLKEVLESASQNRDEAAAEVFEDLYLFNQSETLGVLFRWLDRRQPGRGLSIQVDLPYPKERKQVQLPSVAQYWSSARCAELEAEMLFGVHFDTNWMGGLDLGLRETDPSHPFPMRKTVAGGNHA